MSRWLSLLVLLSALLALGLLQACGVAGGTLLAAPQTGSISGRVYFDDNANLGCDECECGLSDVSIRLYNGACGGDEFKLVKSDADGYFEFTAVSAGQYCVFSDLAPVCDGYRATTSISQQVQLEAGQSIELDGFGYDLYRDTLKAE